MNFIVETLRTELPILEEYYDFTTIGEYDDIGLVPKILTFFDHSHAYIDEIYTNFEV